MSCAKTAEPVDMSFGMWTRVGPRKHVLDWVDIGVTWRIHSNRPCAAAMHPFLWSPYVIGQTIIFSYITLTACCISVCGVAWNTECVGLGGKADINGAIPFPEESGGG